MASPCPLRFVGEAFAFCVVHGMKLVRGILAFQPVNIYLYGQSTNKMGEYRVMAIPIYRIVVQEAFVTVLLGIKLRRWLRHVIDDMSCR